jgi:uncharacterized protein YkwD
MHARLGLIAGFIAGSASLLAAGGARADCGVPTAGLVTCTPTPPTPLPAGEQQPAPQPQPPQTGVVAGAPQRLLDLMNADRAKVGAPSLSLRADVGDIALGHSRDMAAKGEIFHNDGYFTAAVRSRLHARILGENVAMNPDVDDAHRRLMNSPGHRANILDARFTVVGVAVVRTGDGEMWFTEDFLQPAAVVAARPARPIPAARAATHPAPAAPAPAAAAAEVPAPSSPAVPAPAILRPRLHVSGDAHGSRPVTGAAAAMSALLGVGAFAIKAPPLAFAGR